MNRASTEAIWQFMASVDAMIHPPLPLKREEQTVKLTKTLIRVFKTNASNCMKTNNT